MSDVYKLTMSFNKFGTKSHKAKLKLIKETAKMYSLAEERRRTKLPKGAAIINPSVVIKYPTYGVNIVAHVYYEEEHEELAKSRLLAKVSDVVRNHLEFMSDLKMINEDIERNGNNSRRQSY